jgi:DNA polymerase III delta prime subunit
MKYFSSKFEEYITNCHKYNMHKNIKPLYSSMSCDLAQQNHLIFNGPSGIGKYTQVLNYIKKYSPTDLRFERKINITSSNKKIEYEFKVSDIHFEVDMALLGCHAKLLFNDIYYHILDVLSARPSGSGIIVCKNFDHIHSELLEIFYSYMQTLQHKNLNVVYILITENVSFIPRNILNRCQVVPLKRPTKGDYMKATSKTLMGDRDIKTICNIKNIKGKIDYLNNLNKVVCDNIIDKIINFEGIKFLELRDNLYQIFIFNLDIHSCLYYIVNSLVKNGHLLDKHMEDIFIQLPKFLKLYNNNYRPIYHLESFIFYLCIKIHEL